MTTIAAVLVVIVLFLVVLQVSVPYTFVGGTVIDPDQMNTNLSTLGNAILNRGGGAMTGTLAVQPGTTAVPGFSSFVDAATGLHMINGALDVCVSGAARFTLTPTSATFFGNALINSAGKIPDLSATYFAAISASNFTTGTVPAARLGSGTTDATTYLRGDSTWASLAGSLAFPYVLKNANYTAAIGEFVECTSGTFTVTLPTAIGNAGRTVNVKNTGTGVITVDGFGTETIDTALTYVLNVQFQSVTLVSNGASWVVA